MLDALISLCLSTYRVALRRYPVRFRREWGAEMCQALEWRMREQYTARGLTGVIWIWWRALVDVARPMPTLRVGRAAAVGADVKTGWGEGGMGMFGDFVTDVRHAVRNIGRTPMQAGVLVLTLALGMGATTSIFSVLNGVLFSPLAYEDPDELITVRHRIDAEGVGLIGPGGADLLDYQQGVPSVEAWGAIQTLESNLNDDQGAARITMGWTTPDFWDMLGTQAALGRVLEASDWAGADRAQMEDPNFVPPPMSVVLGHDLWTSRFGGDPGVLGRDIRVNGQGMNVIGVLPAGFRLHMPADAEVSPNIDVFALMPVPLSDMGRGGGGLSTLARLGDGVSLERATAELEQVAAELRATHEVHSRYSTEVVVSPLHAEVVRPAKSFLWILFGAVGLTLMIACTNVANLLLVRAASRETEFAVRSALGVTWGRVLRQLFAEGLVLAALGSGIGLMIAMWAVQGMVALRPANLPRIEGIGLDGTVLAFSMALTVGVAVLFGLVPAIAARGGDPRKLVSSRGAGASRTTGRARNLLIVAEVAVSVILVVGAGLLLRSFGQLQRVDLGFEADGRVAVDVALPFFGYRADARRAGFYVDLTERVSELPGVVSVGVTPQVPLEPTGSGSWSGRIGPDGQDLNSAEAPQARFRALTPGTLEALGARLVAGRELSFADERSEGIVPVVIDRRLAEAHWPDGALDRTFNATVAGYTGQGSVQEMRVVGVVEPVRFTSVSEADEPTLFVPYRIYAPVDGTVIVQTAQEPAAVLAGVRDIVQSLDATIPTYSVRRLDTVVAQATSEARYALLLVGIFAVTALVLAAVGLYGVVSTLVQQRTREIGIRIAHGAGASDIRRMVLWDGGRVVGIGVIVGLAASVFAAPLAQSLLFGVDPIDPRTMVATAAALGLVSLVASTLPAHRATRVDPVEALRES